MVRLRLDRFLANSNFYNLFANFQVANLDWAKSDHRPIQLSILGRDQGYRRGRGCHSFKFEEWWTRQEECRRIIQRGNCWGSEQEKPQPLHHALIQCSFALKGWGFVQNKRLKMEIKEVKEKLKREYERSSSTYFSIIHALEKRLDTLLLEEEMYW